MADFIKDTLAKVPGVDPRVAQRAQLFSGMNEGPAVTASRLTGLSTTDYAHDASPYYTTNFGQPISDPAHSLNVGGIPYQGDTALLEKQMAFDRSKITERIVHPCGSSAFGYFQVENDISHLTKADFLQPGKKTPVNCRFSTVTYGREYPDLARNPRGMAVKFYTSDGNYDLVGLNWPIFFLRDPMMGVDNIRSQQRHPKSFMLDYNAWFDFMANVPESIHAGTMLMSDHGTPDGWMKFNGFGCHTFRWVNKDNAATLIKYHWISQQGTKNLTRQEAQLKMGEDPDYSKRQLFEHIESGKTAGWTMKIQTMTPAQAKLVTFDPFDVTKVWPRGEFPMQSVGSLILDRNPEDYHRDVEQAAFSPGSLVPGIELSPDTLLQWRAFFYRDAQMHRLASANIHQIPVNCPFMAKVHSPDNFNGTMRVDANHAGKPVYWPNSYYSGAPSRGTAPSFKPDAAEAPYQVADNIVSRASHYRHEGDISEYDQVRELYLRVMSQSERDNLHSNTAYLLKTADSIVQVNYLIQLYAVSPKYAQGIWDLLPSHEGYTMEEIKEGSKTAHLVNKSPEFGSRDKAKTISFMGMTL